MTRTFLAILVLAGAVSLVHAQATYSVLYNFDENPHGCCAYYPAILAQGRDGNVYGTEFSGGTSFYGTVFVMTPAGALTVLHSFIGGTDGMGPQGGLSLGTDGNFYGTTYQGGSASAGTIFKIAPSGTLTILYNFLNNGDGGFARTPPVMATDSNLYGVSANHSSSALYRITPAGTFTVLKTLEAESDGPLLQAKDGKLYGTTLYGGTFNAGTIFSVTTNGVFQTLYSFSNNTGGNPQAGLLQASDGNFYGGATTGGTSSGGVIFKFTLAGVYTVLRNLSAVSSADGYDPAAGLVQGSDGFLYGVLAKGGTGYGTIFRMKTDGSSFRVLYTFDKATGAGPYSTPMLHTNGKIYGLTQSGGNTDNGVMYVLDAALQPFASVVVSQAGKVGSTIEILGQGFQTATAVQFGTGSGTFTASSDTYMTAKVGATATTGKITVKEPSGNLVTSKVFRITPTITSFSPTSGPPGTSVIIKGTSLSQTSIVKFGGIAATVFTIDSNTQVTALVPSGAVTGKISITTPGGTGSSSSNFTVN